MSGRGDIAAAVLLALAVAIVLWIRLLPLSLPALPERAAETVRTRIGTRLAAQDAGLVTSEDRWRAAERWIAAHPGELGREVAAETTRLADALQYTDEGGRRRPFLGDFDSYAWLRAARNYLRRGSVCDEPPGDACRDRFTLAPVGTAMRYGRSLHVAAIVALHRVATWLDPRFPLAASAYLVPVLVGALGVVPAFAIGRRLAGPVGGFVAGVASALHPTLLNRSLGSDNDVWNVVLPCTMVWAVIAALQARRRSRQIAAAVLAGGIAGLHAATWRGWTFTAAVILAGLGAALVLHALRWGLERRSLRVWHCALVRSAAVVLLTYGAAAAAFTYAAGAEQWSRPNLAEASRATADSPPRDGLQWPSALAQVGELSVPTLGVVAAQSYGNLIVFVGWLGMLLVLLPRHDWAVPHFVVLIGATLLYRYLLAASDLARGVLVALLLLPLVAAALVALRVGDDADLDGVGPGLIIAAWLLAALLMSYQGLRFVLLLAAPLGIACGAAAGRLHLWLARAAREQLGARAGAWPEILAGAVVLGFAGMPVSTGYATARAYLPSIDRAWADTFEQLRTTTPPDAIVNVWWDYGYWTKYLAERAVSADGGTLLTHVPHWLARAELATSEAEGLGLLRMLNCGSDALPYPEGAAGAYGKLLQHGLGGLDAYNALVQVATADRAAADRRLAGLGMDAAARADVLASTHCRPPASYLVLSSSQAEFDGWWQLGTWDPNRDGAAASHGRALVTTDWAPCVAATAGARRCEIRHTDASGTRIDAVVYADEDPYAARVMTISADGMPTTTAPDLLMLVGSGTLERVGAPDGTDSGTAVLLDRDRRRVLVGSPAALSSLYTRLVYLDGLDTSRFHKISERSGAWGQRVSTWQIEW